MLNKPNRIRRNYYRRIKRICIRRRAYRIIFPLTIVLLSILYLSRSNYPKIDLIYTWVNGSDPAFFREKLYWLALSDNIDPQSASNVRFFEHDELRYSLRSAKQNVPWINHVYIVTNGQIPSWIDLSNAWISIVTHREIMPLESLPTFNSQAIEANIHKIRGLSEYFLYANDDCFFYRPLSPEFFFSSKGKVKVLKGGLYFSDEYLQKHQNFLYANNVFYSATLLYKKFKVLLRFEVSHNVKAFRKSLYSHCSNRFPEEFNFTTFKKFRAPKCINLSMISYYAIIIGKGEVVEEHDRHFSNQVYLRIGSREKMREVLHQRNPALLCINDEDNTTAEEYAGLPLFLQELFPKKESWEL